MSIHHHYIAIEFSIFIWWLIYFYQFQIGIIIIGNS
mgnify:CR=1 FL=1